MSKSIIEEISSQKLTTFCQRWKITELALFGSVTREDFRPDSDIEHPEIPWRSMVGLRNIFIPKYADVRAERVWVIATISVPELIGHIEPLIPPLPTDR
jgi:uncharacterized protein with HEPN domain